MYIRNINELSNSLQTYHKLWIQSEFIQFIVNMHWKLLKIRERPFFVKCTYEHFSLLMEDIIFRKLVQQHV